MGTTAEQQSAANKENKMLDIMYKTKSAFFADCKLLGMDGNTLIRRGYYVPRFDGSVISAEYLNNQH